MKVELAKLRPNSWRDFRIDPLEKERAAKITASINESGFWSGVVLREMPDGELEIVAGSTRVYAAIEAGIKYAECFVRKFDDRQVIRVYATENATHRGMDVARATGGAIASAIRYIVYNVLKNDPTFVEKATKVDSPESVRGQIVNGAGLGAHTIVKFFEGINGFTQDVIADNLANLKKSGEYARIVQEISDQLQKEAEAEAARREQLKAEAEAKAKAAEEAKQKAAEAKAKADADAAEKAAAAQAKKDAAAANKEKKAAEKAVKESDQKLAAADAAKAAAAKEAAKPVTFDLVGVSEHLDNASQIKRFRKVLEREGIKGRVPLSVQAGLALQLRHLANLHHEGRLTGEFIDVTLTKLIEKASWVKFTPEQIKAIGRESVQKRWNYISHQFCRRVADANKYAAEMIATKQSDPHIKFSITQELRTAVRFAKPITELAEKLGIEII